MLRLYDFKCPKCCKEIEKLIELNEIIYCDKCGTKMVRMVGSIFNWQYGHRAKDGGRNKWF